MKESREKKLDALEDRLGYHFRNRGFLLRALTHTSYAHEQAQAREHKNPDTDAWIGHYERLEFLGDAVLDLIISHLLMEKFKHILEGDLSQLRASLVNMERLAKLATKLKLGQLLLLGKGEKATGGRKKPSILSDVYEAVIGAIYLDGGFDAAFSAVSMHYQDLLEKASREDSWHDYKTEIQEQLQALYRKTPSYRVIREKGPEHRKAFEVELRLGKKILGRGRGRSKKEAEQHAAKDALEKGKRSG